MNRRDFFKLGGLLSTGALLGNLQAQSSSLNAPQHATASTKPLNILWVVLDDLGYGDFGCYGAKDIPTPTIDALAKDGLLFERSYVCPVCSPTRASLLTGRYPQDFRMEDALVGERGGLSPDPTTAAEHFRAHGYRTACIGKWHLGKDEASHPMTQGFDRFYGFLSGALHYENHTYCPPSAKDESKAYLDFYDNKNLCHDTGHTTDLFTDKALEEIRQSNKAQKPFFLYLSFNAPHYARGIKADHPRPNNEVLQAPQAYIDRFAKDPQRPSLRELYEAVTNHADDSLKRVFDELKASGQWENTLVAVLSDNGATLPHGGSNGSLRGQKHTLWEGGIRTPLIVRLPANAYPMARRGVRITEPHFVRDIFPTTAALAGCDYVAADGSQTGFPQYGLWLRGQADARPRTELFKYGERTAAISGPWKWIRDNQSKPAELYNVAEDMGETKNLADTHAERCRELENAWKTWYTPYAKRELENAKNELVRNQARVGSGKEDAGLKWAKGEVEKTRRWATYCGIAE